MVTLMVRAYAGEADLEPIARFLNLCEIVDRFGQYYTATDLQQEVTEPGCDPSRHIRLWFDSTGDLIGFAQLWFPLPHAEDTEAEGYLWFRVRPNARGQGLETDMMAWGEVQVWAAARDRGLPGRLRTGCRDSQSDRILLFENCGLTYERCFLRMERSLLEPLPEFALPEGFVLSHSQGQADRVQRLEAHNQSFIDHWNFHPMTIEELQHWEQDPKYRPELDLIAVADDGTYAAYCHCHIDATDNAARGCREGWINTLGTRRGFRRRGLGRSMLVAGLVKLRDQGMEVAKLGVDTGNINQAQTLYESVGFRRAFANLAYSKVVETKPG
jgi:mycothiol synthase